MDEIEEVKKETIADTLITYKNENDIELTEKVNHKKNLDLDHDYVEISRLFVRCFKDFRNKFRYSSSAQDFIIDKNLDVLSSNLIACNMEYFSELSFSCVSQRKIMKVVRENYYIISDFLNLYQEIKESGASKFNEILEKLSKESDDGKKNP